VLSGYNKENLRKENRGNHRQYNSIRGSQCVKEIRC